MTIAITINVSFGCSRNVLAAAQTVTAKSHHGRSAVRPSLPHSVGSGRLGGGVEAWRVCGSRTHCWPGAKSDTLRRDSDGDRRCGTDRWQRPQLADGPLDTRRVIAQLGPRTGPVRVRCSLRPGSPPHALDWTPARPQLYYLKQLFDWSAAWSRAMYGALPTWIWSESKSLSQSDAARMAHVLETEHSGDG
jgi:hypothetical protein